MRTPLPALLLTVLLVAGCSGSGDDAGSADTSAAAPAAGAADESATGGGDSAGATGGGTQLLDLRAAPGLAVIRTADLEVRVDDARDRENTAGPLESPGAPNGSGGHFRPRRGKHTGRQAHSR